MARLDERILGYYKGKVVPTDCCKLVNALLKLGICSDITADGEFFLRRRDKDAFSSYAKAKLRFDLGSPLGLYGAISRLRHTYGVIAALILAVFVFVFSSGRVWDVRIDGNGRLTDYEIEESLATHGLKIGSSWRKVDKNALETDILTKTPDIAWISVNRRGTVAYVQVIESENIGAKEEQGYVFSNIVADRDGVIEEITVKSGVASVKVGDVVRKGEVLISGVIESEQGVRFCRAEGSVRASCVATVSADVSASSTEKIPKSHKLAEIKLVAFNFSINIFKNYGNYGNGCDIIKENRKFALFDKFRLPIRIEKTYVTEYEERQVTRSEDEMTEVAKRQLDGKIYSMFKNADVVKLRTYGELIDGVYRITSRVVYSTDIGKESALEIN